MWAGGESLGDGSPHPFTLIEPSPLNHEGVITMTAPKKPQDHQESADQKPKVEKVAGGRKITFPKLTTLVDGKRTPLTVQVEDDAFNDFELLDDLRSLDVEQNASRLPSVLRRVVAEADFRTVMDALRDPKTGRVTITAGTDFVQELFGAINPNS